MPPIRRQRKSSDTKQRSFHLTDDVYNIVEREASAQGISNSSWVSNLIAAEAPPSPSNAQLRRGMRNEIELPVDAAPAAPAPKPAKRAEGIVLPDESISEFSVDKTTGRVHGKRLKSDNELSGVEGGDPRKKKRRRNEEIDL